MLVLGPRSTSRTIRVALSAMVALLLCRATAATAGTAPIVPVPCLECAFDPPTVIVTTPGSTFALTGPTVSGDYLTALSCGDQACAYLGAFFEGIVDPLSVAGD